MTELDELIHYAKAVQADICDSDSGWYYQFAAAIEKAERKQTRRDTIEGGIWAMDSGEDGCVVYIPDVGTVAHIPDVLADYEENARKIVAAPAMYEALCHVVENMVEGESHTDDDGNDYGDYAASVAALNLANGSNAGCDKCGTADRVVGSKLCADCEGSESRYRIERTIPGEFEVRGATGGLVATFLIEGDAKLFIEALTARMADV